jgi:hypothetical protein
MTPLVNLDLAATAPDQGRLSAGRGWWPLVLRAAVIDLPRSSNGRRISRLDSLRMPRR